MISGFNLLRSGECPSDQNGAVTPHCGHYTTPRARWTVGRGNGFEKAKHNGVLTRPGQGGRADRFLGRRRKTTRQESGRCDIKGNIRKIGTRIHHVPGGGTTTRAESTRRRGNSGSAPRGRHERRDDAPQGKSPRVCCGAARRWPSVRRIVTVAGRWKRAPRSVPDDSRCADATLLERVESDSRPGKLRGRPWARPL